VLITLRTQGPISLGSMEESTIRAACSRSRPRAAVRAARSRAPPGRERLQVVILGHLAGALHPAQEHFSRTGIGNGSFSETTFDVGVGRRLASSARGARLRGQEPESRTRRVPSPRRAFLHARELIRPAPASSAGGARRRVTDRRSVALPTAENRDHGGRRDCKICAL
jgi:hypothetical protein